MSKQKGMRPHPPLSVFSAGRPAVRAVSAAAAAAAVVQHAPKRHGQPCRQQRQHGPFQPAHASGDQQQELIQPRRNAPGYNALEHRNDCAAQPAAQLAPDGRNGRDARRVEQGERQEAHGRQRREQAGER